MNIDNKKISEYLHEFGWSSNRKVALPEYINKNNTPKVVVSIIENIYGLELLTADNYKRSFVVRKAYIDDFDDDIEEWKEDLDLDLKLYPLGHMSEYGGMLVLDNYGRFFLADSDLVYYGESFEEFLEVVVFATRSGIVISEKGEAHYCCNNENTGCFFDVDKGLVRLHSDR